MAESFCSLACFLSCEWLLRWTFSILPESFLVSTPCCRVCVLLLLVVSSLLYHLGCDIVMPRSFVPFLMACSVSSMRIFSSVSVHGGAIFCSSSSSLLVNSCSVCSAYSSSQYSIPSLSDLFLVRED